MANTTQIKGNVEIGDGTSTVLTIKKPITPDYTYPVASVNNIGFITNVALSAVSMTNGTEASTPNIAFGNGTYIISVQSEIGSATFTGLNSIEFRIKRDTVTLMLQKRSGTNIDPSVDNFVECFSVAFSGPCNITLTAKLSATTFPARANFFPYYNYVRVG